jgi:glycosyltransferase involved in cell wall biosynthesis
MAYNVPVASSDRSCLPEILQDAAYYFNPEKPQEISDAMQHLLIDKNLRQRLIERGQKLCTSYSWDQLAQKTLDIYQNYQY